MARDELTDVAAPEEVIAAAGAAASGLLELHYSAAKETQGAGGQNAAVVKDSADQVTVFDLLPLLDLLVTTVNGEAAVGNGGDSTEKEDGEVNQEQANNKVQNIDAPPKPRGPPVRVKRKKKLLILDLNGLLADINQDYHSSHLSHGKVRGKLVFKRPYCDDFLRFCVSNFELAIWSSRLKANTDAVVDILMKDLKHHLLFCWDASKCAATGHYTIENKNKPLVLKELKKLWNKEEPDLPWQQGEFSPSNTLLVDDSPYKALRNPPNTAIFPYSYSYKNEKDDSLGPGGDLRLYLEELATADDVQRYVMEHPFGQLPITERNPNWKLYAKVLDGRVP
ncbi:unnamed protein product [Urochloa decumbens]|uniref:Mitochondrial import inner membrane translocase subunit TIM50 n=1 Tax=Urochloa decumbens TaxID=240449 RepID=A0ABC9GDK6_9POAL